MHVLSRSGDRYQFRHELMRQYLAACWLVRESAGIQDLVARLEDNELWGLGKTQQREVFAFMAELVANEEDLQAVADCAGANIGQRSVLAEAVQETAGKRTWNISIKLKKRKTY
jgi:hypothetical protein